MTTLKSQAIARAEADKAEDLKRRAARQAAKKLVNPADIPVVEAVVLPMGADKISMGEHVGGIGEAYFEEGETITIQLPTAVALFDRGYVNFPDARQASEDARQAHRAAERAARAQLTADEEAAIYG